MVSYGGRGKGLEQLVSSVCSQLRTRGLAAIDKVATPIRVLSSKGARVSGVYGSKSTVDFIGTLKGGRSIAFDCKETKTERLDFSKIQDHQIEYLKEVDNLGGEAFLLVHFSASNKYYRLNYKDLAAYMKEPYKTNLKSIPISFFKTYCIEIEQGAGLAIDFIKDLI